VKVVLGPWFFATQGGKEMKKLFVLIFAGYLLGMAPDFAAGNPVPDWPREYLEIYTFVEKPTELPSYVCAHALVNPGPPEVWENVPLPCYAAKLPYNFAYVPIHVAHLFIGLGGGYKGVECGIETRGEDVTFIGAGTCPGFVMGPSGAGPPAAIAFLSTGPCYDWQFHAGYTIWQNQSTRTGATYFDIVANADYGDYYVLDCDYVLDDTTAVGHGAQWGGTKNIACCENGPTAVEVTTWGKIKGLYR
jgi:hypothetical protein